MDCFFMNEHVCEGFKGYMAVYVYKECHVWSIVEKLLYLLVVNGDSCPSGLSPTSEEWSQKSSHNSLHDITWSPSTTSSIFSMMSLVIILPFNSWWHHVVPSMECSGTILVLCSVAITNADLKWKQHTVVDYMSSYYNYRNVCIHYHAWLQRPP